MQDIAPSLHSSSLPPGVLKTGQSAVQDTGLAQIQLDDEGLETVARIDRPAAVGDRLVLRCALADLRSGLYRLEEALQLAAEVGYAGEDAEAADGEDAETSHDADTRVAIVL